MRSIQLAQPNPSTINFAQLLAPIDGQALKTSKLAGAIDRLSCKERLVLCLCHHEGLTTIEVAAVLDLPVLEVLRLHDNALERVRVILAISS